ncbi:MAG: Lrp/AsnC family transcriptional regulator [Chloroflexi bacterium]|nr:Lrp/AsnC family transcriptional regulator [Chloroflexota bacterium]
MIDDTDRQILMLLQDNARLSNAAVAEQVGLTASTVFERIKKLEKRGIIKKYVALVDPEALGKPITAFIRLTVGTTPDEDYETVKKQLIQICRTDPDIQECHTVAGEDCYILKVRIANTQQLEKLLERMRTQAMVIRSTSNIVLSTFKEETKISSVR